MPQQNSRVQVLILAALLLCTWSACTNSDDPQTNTNFRQEIPDGILRVNYPQLSLSVYKNITGDTNDYTVTDIPHFLHLGIANELGTTTHMYPANVTQYQPVVTPAEDIHYFYGRIPRSATHVVHPYQPSTSDTRTTYTYSIDYQMDFVDRTQEMDSHTTATQSWDESDHCIYTHNTHYMAGDIQPCQHDSVHAEVNLEHLTASLRLTLQTPSVLQGIPCALSIFSTDGSTRFTVRKYLYDSSDRQPLTSPHITQYITWSQQQIDALLDGRYQSDYSSTINFLPVYIQSGKWQLRLYTQENDTYYRYIIPTTGDLHIPEGFIQEIHVDASTLASPETAATIPHTTLNP